MIRNDNILLYSVKIERSNLQLEVVKMRDYMKKTNEDITDLSADEVIDSLSKKTDLKSIGMLKFCIPVLVVIVCVGIFLSAGRIKLADLEFGDNGTISLVPVPIAATTGKKDVIGIPTGIVKAHPFLPYRNIGDAESVDLVNDVPKFDLIAPPELQNENSDTAKVMDTVVSGILFDKYSPSAILNINGSDYLVKKGDTVNNYKILAIARDSVTVQLGKNTFKAGIGEILTDGTVNYNQVSNLNKKFGGEQR